RFIAWSNAHGDVEKKPSYAPTKAKVGRLRLVRNGSKLAYYGAGGGDESFTLIREHAVGGEEFRDVSVFAQTGSPQGEVDVRFTDIVIRAQTLSNVSAAEETSAAPATDQSTQTTQNPLSWMMALALLGLLFGIGIVSALGLGWWFLKRQRGGAATP